MQHRKHHWTLAASALVAVLCPVLANAGVSEVRGGLMVHNIRVSDPKNADKEDGPNLELEILFDSPS